MFKVQPDIRQGLKMLSEVNRQITYAGRISLNDIALLFQTRQRAHQESIFTIRRKTWWKRAVKISKFANKADPFTAIVQIQPPGKSASWLDIFERHEEGGTRRPRKGGRHLAIPKEAGRTSTGLVRKPERPRRAIERGAFVIEMGNGRAGVFRRNTKRGRGRKKFVSQAGQGPRAKGAKDPNLEFLYYMVPEGEIDAVYEFFENAEEVWNTNWRPTFERNLLKALETARPSARGVGGGRSRRGGIAGLFR